MTRALVAPPFGPHQLNGAHDVHAPHDGAEYDVLAVQPARLGDAQEELHADKRGKGELASVQSGEKMVKNRGWCIWGEHG